MRFFKHFFSSRTYLDYASSTPLDRRMRRKVPRIDDGANPSALHREGVEARRLVEAARERVARVLDAHPDEIIYTSSATESNNLAIAGTISRWIADGIDPMRIAVYTSELEHAAVAEVIEQFVPRGVQHNVFPLADGIVDPKHLIVPESAKAVLVSVMYVANEIGTVQPIAEIAKRIRRLKKQRPETAFVFHTDATQAPAHQPLRAASLGIDLMTLGTTKLYCQTGVGMLYRKRSHKLLPLLRGGGQEFGLRPGTEPVALIHEASFALAHAAQIREEETARVTALQQQFEELLRKRLPQVSVTASALPRSPHISHVAIQGFDSELLVLELDARGIAVSAKSACKNEEAGESAIVEKLYGTGWGAVRFSFGRMTKTRDLRRAVSALAQVLRKYQPSLEKR